jgi:hypothetical protein
MVTVRVYYKESGKAAKGVAVSLGFNGLFRGVTGKGITDSSGDADFDNDPGYGKVYIHGKSVFEGRIEGRTVVYI